MLTIQTYHPTALQHLVKSFWYLEVPSLPGVYEEAIIPDGHHEIIFHANAHTAKRQAGNQEWSREPDAFVAGQTLKSYRLQLLPRSRLYGIRFHPHTLFTLLGVPANNLTENIIALNAVTNAQPFWNCVTDNSAATFRNFEQLLLKRMAALDFQSTAYRYVEVAVAAIIKDRGAISIDTLIKKTGVSVKYLDTLFKKHVGLTPKALSRILQLNHFCSYKCSNPQKSLTECGYEAGYYDQSHAIKAFQYFTNKTPGDYFSNAGHINPIFTAH